jgi:uncharacterized protein
MAGRFEVYEDKAGKYRFRLKAGNGEVVATRRSLRDQSGSQERLRGCPASGRRRHHRRDCLVASSTARREPTLGAIALRSPAG